MSDLSACVQQALDAGFTRAALVETKSLQVFPEVRDMCAATAAGSMAKIGVVRPDAGHWRNAKRGSAGIPRGS